MKILDTVYQVVHLYDMDGGFGDAIPSQEVLCTFENREDAEVFVDEFQNPHVYDKPYNELHCGRLEIRPEKIISHSAFDIQKLLKSDFQKRFLWWCEEFDGGFDSDDDLDFDDEDPV